MTAAEPVSPASIPPYVHGNDEASTPLMERKVIPVSEFSVERMPHDKIFKRTLHSWSVHHSLSTANWIATLSRPMEHTPNCKVRHVQFIFRSESEGKKFCKSYAPPKFNFYDYCQICDKKGERKETGRVSMRNCRNCGVSVCDGCSTRWTNRMIPKTYMLQPTSFVRVCKSCDWLSNAFCMALLKGRPDDALTIHASGNVNLRTSFADIRNEAMFPVHCAVMGGQVELLKWLVDVQGCPISSKNDPKTQAPLSLRTSLNRSLLDLAMTGRPKPEVLMYLIQKGISIHDVKDPTLATRTLENLLKVGFTLNKTSTTMPLEIVEIVQDESVSIDDACNICFEHQVDCVLTPCGHQICCAGCGVQLALCPVCKVECSVLKVYR